MKKEVGEGEKDNGAETRDKDNIEERESKAKEKKNEKNSYKKREWGI